MEERQFQKLMRFNGDHSTLVGLRIMNNILKVLTLGLYYPWARAAELRYMYGESEYMGSRFTFHGTGTEMFKGFIKAIAAMAVLYILFFYLWLSGKGALMVAGVIIFYAGMLCLLPLAIHGSNKYRLSRTSWRGIHFGYRGDLKEFFKLYMYHGFLSVITLGIYSSWFSVKMQQYIMGRTRFGNVEFRFSGDGFELFIIKLKGFFFSVLTLGIYLFWYMKQRVEFEIKSIKVIQDGKEINTRCTFTAGQIFEMVVVNYLIIIFTFGIGTGIAINRLMRKTFNNVEFDLAINPDLLVQTEAAYTDATGDDLADMLDASVI
jgi:uncharacterized membrane protein YjgN (DUF898 family)